MANNIDYQPLSLDHLLLSSVVDNIYISSIMKLTLASILLFGAATIPSASSIRVLRSLDKLGTIVDIAEANEDFSILVAAVKTSRVAETLAEEGPFTVFAPTHNAFVYLPEGTVDTLLLLRTSTCS